LRSSVKKWIREHNDEALQLLRQMVNTDSGTHDPDGVNKVARMCEQQLSALGFSIRRHSAAPYGDHLEATLESDGAKRLLLVGHMDTVFERGTARARPFSVDGDRIAGPGVHDMKSGLVSAVYALKALMQAGFRDFGRITLLLNSDEEVGSPTSRLLIEALARSSDIGFVLECAYPDGSIVTARKGVGMYKLVTRGVSAHAGAEPEKGVNAIVLMAEKILDAAKISDAGSGTTVNVGVIRGGTRRNVVPDFAEAEIDVRVATTEEAQRVHRCLGALSSGRLERSSVELTGGLNRPPMERTPEIERLYRLVREEAHDIGLNISERSTGGASDGNFVAHTGIPVLDGMGPQGGFAHSLDEYMQLSTFPLWVMLLAQSILAVCESR